MTTTTTEFDKVLQHAGGVSKLAVKLGMAQGVVSGWKSRGVSREGALAIETAYPRKFKALKLVGVTATKCFIRTKTATVRQPRKKTRAAR